MNRVESFITAHIGDNINECDDNFAVNIANNRFAVADGSSSDFFSNIYAKLLADTFVAEGKEMFEEERIKELNLTWRNQVQQKLSDAGCKPGSFPYVRFQKMDPGCSTLIGLHLYESDADLKYRCSGLGDSVLFFIPKGEKIPSLQFSSYSNKEYSLDQSVEFGYVPIISRSYSTKWIDDLKEVEGKLQEGVFYLMTDGLAEWILRRDNGEIFEKFEMLSNIHSQEDFLSYIDDIRSKGAHNDDMTLMKVYIDNLSLSFDSSLENVYDYRSAADNIEKEELAKRQKSVSREEELAQQKAAVVANKKSEMDALLARAKARTAAENQRKEKVEKEKREEKTKAVLDAAQAKVSEENDRKALFEKELAEEKKKWEEEQEPIVKKRIDDAVAEANRTKDEEFVEREKQRIEKEQKAVEEQGLLRESEAEKELAEEKKKWEEEQESFVKKRIEDAVAEANRTKDEEFAEREKQRLKEEQKVVEEKKKVEKSFRNFIKTNGISLLLLVSLISCAFYIMNQHNNQPKEGTELTAALDSINKIHNEYKLLLQEQTKKFNNLDSINKQNIVELNNLRKVKSEYEQFKSKALTEIDKLKEKLNTNSAE